MGTNFLSNGVGLGDILYLSTTPQTNMSEVPNYLTGGNKWYALTYPVTNPPTNYDCVTSPTNYFTNGTDLSQTFSPIYYIYNPTTNPNIGTVTLSTKCTKIYFVLIGNGGNGGFGNGSNGGSGGGGGSISGYITIPSGSTSCNFQYSYVYGHPELTVITYYPNNQNPNYIIINAYNGTDGSSGGVGIGGSINDNTSGAGFMTVVVSYASPGRSGSTSDITANVSSGYIQNVPYPYAPTVNDTYGIGGTGSNNQGYGRGYGNAGIMQVWVVY